MAMPDSLEKLDATLKARLAAVDDATLREAWHAASERTEALIAIKRSVEAFDDRARLYAIDVIMRANGREGLSLAERLLAVPEIADPNELWRAPDRIPRRQRAVDLLYRNTHLLTAEELARAIAQGRLVLDHAGVYDDAKAKLLSEHPDLAQPARRFAAFVAALEESAIAPRADLSSTLLRWLALRLVEDPYPEGATKLLELLREGHVVANLTDMLGAIGTRPILEELATRVDTPAEDAGAVAALFALDPKAAFDRLGARLNATTRGPSITRLLHVLAQDGFQTHGLAGLRSKRPRGWVRADVRWIEPLLALRANDDPNFSRPARDALANADLDRVLALLPKPKKKIPELSLELLGTLALVRESFPRDPVWLGAGRLVIPSSATTLAIHSIAPGLPRLAELTLPDGVALPTSRASSSDDAWEARGLYDVAIAADGAVAIGAQTDDHEHVLARFDPSGARVALLKLKERDSVFPHALHFGAAGKGALWVAMVGEDAHTVGAFSAATLAPIGEIAIGASFPPPSYFEAVAHPTEDVGVFAIQCGQDGAWLKVIELAPKVAVRKQKLNAKQIEVGLVGFSRDGAVAAFVSGATLALRPWPLLDAPKKKRLDGSVCGAGLVDGALAFAVAEISNAPSAIELRRFPDGERIAKGRYPLGERFVALGEGALVTATTANELRVYRAKM
jgi:hypothetical protein